MPTTDDTDTRATRVLRNVILTACFALSLCIATHALRCCNDNTPSGTVVLTQQSDTVYIHDTIRVVEPTLVAEMATNKTRVYTGRAVKPDNDKVVSIVSDSITMQVPDTTDTVSVELPIIQREYEGENYRAWVSGAVDAQLDSIHVYNNTRVVTNTITATTAQASKPKHWGVGVGVGYGLTPHGLQPMVGVTLSYNLLTW